MTILTDHLNINRNEDPGYWYIWASDFRNTFLFLYNQSNKSLNSKNTNLATLPPQPGHSSIFTIYFASIELYMKTFLLAKGTTTLDELKNEHIHNLDKLRKKCAEIDKRFDDEELKWIINTLKKLTKSDWSQIKYPPNIALLEQKGIDKSKHTTPMGLYGEKVMIRPLELLDEIVKPLVYTKD